ncbi:hypothetical protein Tco_0890676 [Tanacetum coccineum]|uniref:Uncharacterized protein n=1 Tax=Tanacetum coccineum TaxID=301880 RepID=A0ABQ5C6P7_9ASTR
MAAISNVPQLVNKKRGLYSAVAPRLVSGKFNKWKKRMLCYLTGIEPYYIQCIKDGLFKPKMIEGFDKPESQWTPDERRVVNQDQHLKSIIISCLPDDIIESDFQENFDDEVDDRSSEEYLRDPELEFHERVLLANSKRFIKKKNNFSSQKANEDTELSKGFQPKFTPKLIQSSQHTQSSQNEPKFQKEYKDEYKKNEEEVSNNEEMAQVKVLMALADDELSVGKNHARNDEWIDITMNSRKRDDLLALKQAKLEAVTFQIQNTDLKKLNHALQDQLKEERKKKILDGEQLTKSSSKKDCKGNPFIPASLDYDHEMVLKSKDWVERHYRDSKLPNFNTERILVLKSQVVNECLKLIDALTDPESSKESGSEPQTPLHLLKNL